MVGRVVWNPAAERELLASTAMVRMLAVAGHIVADGARRRAPVSPDGSHGRPPGYLRDQIDTEAGADVAGPYVDIVSPAKTPEGAPYGLFVEVGTRPHVIESHGSYPLRDKHGRVFGRRVNHPGAKAQPYLRPALDDLTGRLL